MINLSPSRVPTHNLDTSIRTNESEPLSNFSFPIRTELDMHRDANSEHLTLNDILDDRSSTKKETAWNDQLRQLLWETGILHNNLLLKRLRLNHHSAHPDHVKNRRLIGIKDKIDYHSSLRSLPASEALFAIREDLDGADHMTSEPAALLKRELAKKTPALTQISTLSLNLCAHPILSGELFGSKRRYQEAAHAIEECHADIVALQEIWSGAALKEIKSIGYAHSYHPDKRAKLIGNSGLITLSRFEISKGDFFSFSRRSGIEAFVRKGALFTEIIHPSIGPIHVWNVHLASPPESINKRLTTDEKAGEIRTEQFAELRRWISRSANQDIPILLFGDFNAHLEQDEDEINEIGEDLFATRHQIQTGDTKANGDWATFDPQNNKYARGKSDEQLRLDRVVLPRTQANKRTIALGCSVRFRENPVSDHYGLLSKLAFI